MENTIYKELAKYYCKKTFFVYGFAYIMEEFCIVKELKTKELKVVVRCYHNNKAIIFNYSTEEFENEFKINLADIIDFPLT